MTDVANTGVIFASDYSPYLVGLGKVYQMPPYHEDSKGTEWLYMGVWSCLTGWKALLVTLNP
jgi:hypothetical protein